MSAAAATSPPAFTSSSPDWAAVENDAKSLYSDALALNYRRKGQFFFGRAYIRTGPQRS